MPDPSVGQSDRSDRDHEDSMFGAPMDGFGDLMFYFAIGGFIVLPVVLIAVMFVGHWLFGWRLN